MVDSKHCQRIEYPAHYWTFVRLHQESDESTIRVPHGFVDIFRVVPVAKHRHVLFQRDHDAFVCKIHRELYGCIHGATDIGFCCAELDNMEMIL
jgi:hypothetical protein